MTRGRQAQSGHIHIIGGLLLLAFIGVGIYFALPFVAGPGCPPPPDTVVMLRSDDGRGYCLWAINRAGQHTAMGRENQQLCGSDPGSVQVTADEYNTQAEASQKDCVSTLRENTFSNAKAYWMRLLAGHTQ